jgi:threonine dehydrogenase-like Zn-dependent dehydrogenase
MRGLRNMGKGKVKMVNDLPDPKPGKGQMLIRIKVSAICGSELGSIRAPEASAGNSGHESMGVVEDPNGSTRFKKGDRVGVATLQGCGTCHWCDQGKPDFCAKVGVVGNTHSEFCVSAARWTFGLPDDITDLEGVLLGGDGLGVPWGAAVRGGVKAGDITCVLGCGAVGLGNILTHRYFGARVIAVDINPKRLTIAKKVGAWKTVDASKTKDLAAELLKLTDGLGPDVCVEACGKQPTLDAAIAATKPEGTVVQCGHGAQTLNPQQLICRRNLRVVGNWVCHYFEVQDMIEAIRKGLPAERMVTGCFAMEDAQKAYDRFIAGDEGKVALLH